MNKEQLQTAITMITEAIRLVNECPGYGYTEAHQTTKLMIEQRRQFERQLNQFDKPKKSGRV